MKHATFVGAVGGSTSSITRDLQLLSMTRGDILSEKGKSSSSSIVPVDSRDRKINQVWNQSLPIESVELGRSITFSIDKVTDPDDKCALAQYIRDLRACTPKDIFIDLADDLNKLRIWQLEALIEGGYCFHPHDVSHKVAASGNIQLLFWMRTVGGFSHHDLDRCWRSDQILEMIGRMYDNGRCFQDIEGVVNLVYDKRYWTCDEDRVDFPLDMFVTECPLGSGRGKMLRWFLDRAQFMYPIAKFSSDDYKRGLVSRLLDCADNYILQGKSSPDVELGVKLKSFVQANMPPQLRSHL